jgi:tetratricopeptide (TPR) repeat protein
MPRHPDTAVTPNTLFSSARQSISSPRRTGQGMSRTELADAVNTALDRLYPGRDLTAQYVDFRWIGKLERGEHRWPSDERRTALRHVLGAASDTELDLYNPRRSDGIHRNSHEPAPVLQPDALTELLPAGDTLKLLTATTGRRVGQETVNDLATRVHRLRLADDVLAGGDLITPAFRELRAAMRLYRERSYTEVVGRALLVQLGELAQIAGWIASDAGHHDLAERAYNVGVSAARQAGDAYLAANLAGSLAYQHANTGRGREGVELARAALAEGGHDAPAKARALFLDRLAWAHARAGEARPAVRALAEAHEALLSSCDGEGPQWAYWVTQDELEVMDARVFTELHRPLRAVPLLSKVLDRYDATHAREVALYLSWLAVAYADANEPEAAAGAAARMLDLSDDLTSARTVERTRVVVRTLMPFGDVPEVRALLAERGIVGQALSSW